MSDKPTNGVDAEQEDAQVQVAGGDEEDHDDEDDEDEIPVEVEDAETRPVKVPDLGAIVGDGDAQAVEPADLSEQIEELQQKLETVEKENKDHYERLLRSVADMDNLRKRTRKDVEDSKLDTRAASLKEILPVIDNLDRALTHAEHATDTKGIMDGVKLVLRQFQQALERLNVVPVDAKGQPFDPNIHEAVSQAPSDEVAPGSVLEVLQRGYTIGARLLRPSLVVVAQAPPAQQAPAKDDEEPTPGTEPEPATETEPGSGQGN